MRPVCGCVVACGWIQSPTSNKVPKWADSPQFRPECLIVQCLQTFSFPLTFLNSSQNEWRKIGLRRWVGGGVQSKTGNEYGKMETVLNQTRSDPQKKKFMRSERVMNRQQRLSPLNKNATVSNWLTETASVDSINGKTRQFHDIIHQLKAITSLWR